jgi:hypothetical protein
MRNAELGMNSIGVYSAFRIPQEWSVASEVGGSEWPCEKSAERTQLEWVINRFALKELASMDSVLFMPNEPNSRSSKTEHRVVTRQRVSTRCRLNRLVRSVACCEMSEKGSQWPLERRGMSRGCAKSAERTQLESAINYLLTRS